jgi:hypothetical protein
MNFLLISFLEHLLAFRWSGSFLMWEDRTCSLETLGKCITCWRNKKMIQLSSLWWYCFHTKRGLYDHRWRLFDCIVVTFNAIKKGNIYDDTLPVLFYQPQVLCTVFHSLVCSRTSKGLTLGSDTWKSNHHIWLFWLEISYIIGLILNYLIASR